MRSLHRIGVCLGVTGLVLAAGVQDAEAQAWASGTNTLDVRAGYAYQFADKTFESGVILTGVPTTAHRFNLGADYVVLDKLTISGNIFTGYNQYSGPQTGQPGIILAHGGNDDGNFHFDLTDFIGEVRYQAYEGAVTASPFLRTTIPTTDYEENGYASAGRGLKELTFGAYVGKLGVGLDRIFLHGSYAFTLSEKYDGGGEATEDYTTHRSDLQIQGGYLLTDKIQLFAMFDGRLTHGGWDLIDFPTAPMEVRDNHDPIVSAKYTSVGGGAGYSIRDDMNVGLIVNKVLWGDNVSNALATTLNFTWTADFRDDDEIEYDPDEFDDIDFDDSEFDDSEFDEDGEFDEDADEDAPSEDLPAEDTTSDLSEPGAPDSGPASSSP